MLATIEHDNPYRKEKVDKKKETTENSHSLVFTNQQLSIEASEFYFEKLTDKHLNDNSTFKFYLQSFEKEHLGWVAIPNSINIFIKEFKKSFHFKQNYKPNLSTENSLSLLHFFPIMHTWNQKSEQKWIEQVELYKNKLSSEFTKFVPAKLKQSSFTQLKPFQTIQLKPHEHYFKISQNDARNNVYTLITKTPETLLKCFENKIVSESIAGTFEIDNMPQGLNLVKILDEQKIVTDYICNTLKNCLKIDPHCHNQEVIAFEKLAHLKNVISAPLKQNPNFKIFHKLINTLHPTPALCGYPQKDAYHAIKNIEHGPRNIFTGVIAYFIPQHILVELNDSAIPWGNSQVVIRTCFIKNKEAYIAAGAVVTKNSEIIEESKEINSKILATQSLFNKNSITEKIVAKNNVVKNLVIKSVPKEEGVHE